jgi:hypothetical protein
MTTPGIPHRLIGLYKLEAMFFLCGIFSSRKKRLLPTALARQKQGFFGKVPIWQKLAKS